MLGQIVYVSLHPPEKGDTEVCSADQWRLDLGELEKAFSDKTRMIVSAHLLADMKSIADSSLPGHQLTVSSSFVQKNYNLVLTATDITPLERSFQEKSSKLLVIFA